MGETQSLVAWISSLGVPGILILLAVAVQRKWIVPGWVYQEKCTEFDAMKEDRDRWLRDGVEAIRSAGNMASMVLEKRELETGETNGEPKRSDKAAQP